MAEYIKREAALNKCGWYNTVSGKSICAVRKDELAALPAADVVEVVHGRWGNPIKVDADNNGYKCSECGEFGVPCWHYCPNCGARMDGEQK